MRKVLIATGAALALSAALAAAQAADGPTRAFINTNCQKMSDACIGPIIHALDAAAAAHRIPPKCVAGRPPKQAMALDIALWLYGHHDLDNKPLADSAVITAERLWSCSKVL